MMNTQSTTALSLSLLLLLPVNAFASGSISGKVTLQSRTNHRSPITFKLNNPGETTPFKTYNITTAPDGTYSLTDIPQGTYNLTAKALNSLSQTQVLIEVIDGQTASDTNFRLLGGDANNDNSVATADFGILRKAWLSNPASPNWDPRADFNGDGSVAVRDLIILRINWLKNGSEPQITITSPQDNSLTSNPTISVSGTFSSVNRIVAVIVRGTSAALKNGAFYIDNVFLSEGKNKISAIAINKYNNKNADLITVTLDKTAPTGTIDINNSAQYTNSTTVTLNLSATDSISGLSLMQFSNDNVSWSVPQGYSTSKSWELTSNDGTKTVYAKFSDAAGNQSAPVSNTITLDTTAPVITVTSPQDGFVSTAQTITVSGTIDDSYAAVTVNGTPATVSNNTFTANNIALTQGRNTITATAADPAGNTSSASITVTYQSNNSGDTTPPSIDIYTPDKDSTTRSSIIYGHVSSDTQIVTVNGTPAELLNDYRYVARPTLTEGQNTVIVKAWDASGNLAQLQISFTYNTQTPKVTLTSPLDNSTQNISPINVQGTNTTNLSFILVNGVTAGVIPAEAGIQNFTAEGVILDSTKTVITATGYDANNNKFSDSIAVNSANLSHYELTGISGDASEDDPNRPSAGSSQILKVKLEKNGLSASNEEIQFNIITPLTDGERAGVRGKVIPRSVFTDSNGEATATLTTDTNSDVTNQVECYPLSNPLVKTTFSVDTKPGQPAILTKITDESITPVPTATIPLIVKLTDSNNNPIQDETINFQIISGDGTLFSPTAVTISYGEARVNLTCSNSASTLTQIQASSNTSPSVKATFNITTSAPLTVTVDDIIAKVNQNDSKIQDITADIAVTSDAPWSAPTMQLKIWQKADKQKVEEISPEPKVYIRPSLPQIDPSTFMDRTVVSYDSINNIYVIKSKAKTQTEEYPYEIDHIDYSKGVVIKTECYLKENNFETLQVKEYSDFVQIDDIWGFQKDTEKIYAEGKLIYTTTNIYSNIKINAGIPDNMFQ